MPELPEVQTVVNDLDAAGLTGCRVLAADVSWPRTVRGLTPEEFAAAITGRRFETLSRRAKWIKAQLSEDFTMLIHLRMSGRLHFTAPQEPRSKHEHVALTLDDGRELRFHDTRKFGRMILTREPQETLGKLGVEPLSADFDLKIFEALLAGRSRMIKALLFDQEIVAGLGNIYIDEALWEAKLHPARRADTLTPAELKRLHKAIPLVLERGLKNLGTTLGTGKTTFYSVAGRRGGNKEDLRIFRRTGEACPRCGETVVRLVLAQRSTHVCPRCQAAPD